MLRNMNRIDCPAVLAIELSIPAPALLPQLPTEQAAILVDAIADDLARMLPDVEQLGLAVGGALFDPAQLLRPGWPLFAELAQLYRRQRRGDPLPAVIGFGAAGGRMASTLLEPEPGLGGGTLLLIPWLLLGDGSLLRDTAARMEEQFNEHGLAGAAVALFLQQALGLQVAHARYMTRDDLCALTAIQLEHAQMAAVWLLLETALLAPMRTQFVRSAGGAPWRYRCGAVRGGVFGFSAWAAGPGAALDASNRAETFAGYLLDLRRTAALLGAHALAPQWVVIDAAANDAACAAALDAGPVLGQAWMLETLRERGERPARVVAIAHRVLGNAGFVVLEADDAAQGRVIARLWPLAEGALREGAAWLAARFNASRDPRPVALASAVEG
jgi:hypothetical protein